MKKTLYLLSSLLFASAVFSCNKVNPEDNGPEIITPGSPVTISLNIPEKGLTKVDLTQDADPDGPVKLAWEETDEITVKNAADESKSVVFEYESGAGTTTASFTAVDASALEGATSYNIYLSSGDAAAAEQHQDADEDTGHLGYSATLRGVNKLNGATFSSDWAEAAENGSGTFVSSSVLRLRVQLPSEVAATVQAVTFKADQDIFLSGKTLKVIIDTPGDAGSDGILNVYATLPGGAVIPAGTNLLFQFQVSADENDLLTAHRLITPANTFNEGKVNALKITCPNIQSYANQSDASIGTLSNPYLIGDRNQLQWLAANMTSGTTHITLVDDIDMTGVSWTPMNSASPYNKAVVFDGDGHKIAHLRCDDTKSYPSFFGVLIGSLENITFDDAVITCGANKGGVVAGALGYESTTANCSKVSVTNSSVTTSDNMGGVFAALGNKIGTLSECTISGSSSIEGSQRLGALVGSIADFTEISDCWAEGVTITAESYYAGGLIGQVDGGGNIERCHSTGNVIANHTSYARSGGLIGYIISANVLDSYSTCTVTVKGQFGAGLIGQIKSGNVSRCHATGSVSSSNHYAGGLVGMVEGTTEITKSYYNGGISLPTGSTGKAQAGGIVAYMETSADVTISNCFTAGSWSGRRWFGGIVGGIKADASALSVTNCYTTASITGTPFGAVVGNQGIDATKVTCSGVIASWESGTLKATGNDVTATTYYIGNSSTILSKATDFGWDFDTVWNSVDPPTLK